MVLIEIVLNTKGQVNVIVLGVRHHLPDLSLRMNRTRNMSVIIATKIRWSQLKILRFD